MSSNSAHEHDDSRKRKEAGLFIIGVALFTIGLSINVVAVWIIGLVIVGFAFLVARHAHQKISS